MSRALITGGSAGLGRALAAGLAEVGWEVVITGRDPQRLNDTAAELGPRVTAVVGDVTDPGHRDHLAEVVADGLDLLVNNASTLGTSPLLPVQELTSAVLRHVWETNVVAPVALIRTVRPFLRSADENGGAAVIDITSDAAAEHYESWGAYAASKAALEHLTLTLAAEDPDVRWYAVDPGDLRTQMQQDAFPGEDISDRPLPETVVPAFLALIDRRPPSGRYRAAELTAVAA
jgi:NAD(P)-dependent dehydrogenase (short-subunit alcohol dehydrogenase family)